MVYKIGWTVMWGAISGNLKNILSFLVLLLDSVFLCGSILSNCNSSAPVEVIFVWPAQLSAHWERLMSGWVGLRAVLTLWKMSLPMARGIGQITFESPLQPKSLFDSLEAGSGLSWIRYWVLYFLWLYIGGTFWVRLDCHQWLCSFSLFFCQKKPTKK